MKIHHLSIRGKCYKFIENLYLSSKAYVRVDGQFSESFSIKKEVRQGLSPFAKFYLTYSLITFLLNVINMESLLVINTVMEVSLQMTIVLCAPTRSRLKKLL